MPRPNIVLLCPDEMKASALGCYGQALPVSPILDRMAGRSAVFNQSHTVHPKCVPSRAALLTAQYPHVGGHRTLHLHVRPHEINLVRTLREAGYQTCLFGKNHVVDSHTMPFTFDHWFKDGGRATLEQPAGRALMPAGSYWVGEDPVPNGEWRDTVNTERAIRWLEQERDEARPFLAWINWDSPHPPYKVPAPFFGAMDRSKIELPPLDNPADKPPYQQRLFDTYGLQSMTPGDWREVVATYLDMCRYVDHEVGRVLDTLDRLGLSENTIVVFWSDHGDFAGEHQLGEKWDTCFYDCITRVPLMMSWPGRIEARRIDALVESIDIMPTLLELAGVDVPKGVQGRSLGPLLRGETSEHRDIVFCQGGQEPEMFDRVIPPNGRPRPCLAYQLKQQALYDDPGINIRAKMIRDRRWKYCFHLSGFEELYDLESDPSELRNRAREQACTDVLNRMRMRMMRKLIEAETVEPWQDHLES